MPIGTNKLKTGAETPAVSDAGIKKELKQQRELLLEIYEQSRKTKRYILIGRVIQLIYLLLIIGALGVAMNWLTPLINQFNNIMASPYGELLQDTNSDIGSGELQDFLKQFKK